MKKTEVWEPRDMVIRQNATKGSHFQAREGGQMSFQCACIIPVFLNEPREHYRPEGEPLLHGGFSNIKNGRRMNAVC